MFDQKEDSAETGDGYNLNSAIFTQLITVGAMPNPVGWVPPLLLHRWVHMLSESLVKEVGVKAHCPDGRCSIFQWKSSREAADNARGGA